MFSGMSIDHAQDPCQVAGMTPMAPPGISSTTPLKALGPGLDFFPDFVTMTFQEK